MAINKRLNLTHTMIWRVRCASQVTNQPASRPANQTTRQPTSQPANQPTNQPTNQPANQPANQTTNQPASQPTSQRASQPTSLVKNASNKFFIWHQKNLLFGIKKILSGPGVSKIICFRIFRVFMDGWFGISPASALGSLEPPKPYGSYDLATRRRLNLTHTMIWRPKGTQTLRKL